MDSKRPSVDLIIPVYNSKEYMPGMIDSIERQTFKDFRVIFVDDGSTDGTYEWLSEYLENVGVSYLLLRQENGGPSAARNAGMRASDAEWIVFSDSDDALAPCYLEYLYDGVKDSDAEIGFCSLMTYIRGESEDFPEVPEAEYFTMDAADAMHSHYSSWIAPVCLILKREYLLLNSVWFDEDCRYCEDLIFITDAIAYAKKAVRINNTLYFYLVHPTSLLRSGGTEKYFAGIKALERLVLRMESAKTDAAEEFLLCGNARFLMAVLRRAALQLQKYAEFREFSKKIGYIKYKHQEKYFSKKWKIAALMYRVSPFAFYKAVRLIFKD